MSSKVPLLLLQMWMVTVVVMLGGVVEVVRGYPQGPPLSACGDMYPQGHGVDAKTMAPPYTLSVSAHTIAAGDTVTLTLQATGDATYPYYEGMFVQARRASCDSDDPIGTFSVPQNDDYLKLMACHDRDGSAVSHKTHSHQTNRTFTWTVPDTYQGRLYFRATVVKNKENFWTNVFSGYLTYANDTSQVPSHHCPVRSTLVSASSVPALSAASLAFAAFVTSFFLMNL